MPTPRATTVLTTAAALIAFAANSLLCRRALRHTPIDAVSFSTIRIVSGALVLYLIVRARKDGPHRPLGSWASAALLFLYAVPFSLAYVSLSAGTGALILFGAVQTTMLAIALYGGERPHPLQWAGLAIALAGLVYLVLPGLTAPSPSGSALMAVAGASWGVYSLRGRRAQDPLAETAGNFILAVPMTAAVSAIAWPYASWSARGAWLAVASGAVASGLGYVIWFTALSGLTATRAASVQLAVPVIAAAGGVLLLGEPITWRLIVSAGSILGGVALALVRTERRRPPRPPISGTP